MDKVGWELKKDGQLLYYQCTELNNQHLIQAVTTSSAGNMALHTGDDVAKVIHNRELFLDKLGLNLDQLVAASQIHGTNVVKVGAADLGKGSRTTDDLIPDTDGLISNVPGIILSIYTADCLPIFIYDQATPAIGIVHAGWRGTIDMIVVKTLEKMRECFKTEPINCQIAIGPSICSQCFKVDPLLAERFAKLDPDSVSSQRIRSEDQYYVDLVGFNTRLLLELGVSKDQIYCSNSCTCCQPELLFSHRLTGTHGRIMGIISLVE